MTNWLQARMVRGLIAGCAALCATSVAAQPMQRGFVALGGAVGPDYSGSSDYRVLPFAAARLSFAGVTFESEGLGGRLNLSQTRGFGYGPSFRFRFGRDDSVENDQVAELEEIDEAFEIGGFV
ncbi:MAG: MipA/OmpV family protein, partial [Pseudomonadota bacterium]